MRTPRACVMCSARGPRLPPAVAVAASILLLLMMMAGPALLAADAYRAASLYEQIQNRSDGQVLYCGNPGHLLVLRDNLRIACVYPETAIAKSWHPVAFDGSGRVSVSDSVPVRAHEEDYVISYSITGGLLDSMMYDPDSGSLLLEIRSTGGGGGMEMSVPKKMFLQGSDFFVLEDGQEVGVASLQDEHNYLLQFNFTHPDPVIEVVQVYLLCHPFCS